MSATARVAPRPAVGALVAVGGCAALLARPALLPTAGDPTARLVVLFALLGLVGVLWPLSRPHPAPAPAAAGVLALGCGAFAAGWLVMGGPAGAVPALVPLALNLLAAVTEEAFFRRFVYGLLEPAGTAVAVAVSAAAFAAVHVTVWGLWVLPLDLAAGLLLSWQRAASGRWSVPAATHSLANTLALL